MKTLMSISGFTAPEVLKSLHANDISCSYMGLDQTGRLIMEINLQEGQDQLIEQLNEGMIEREKAAAEITKAFEEAVKKQYLELSKFSEEAKRKFYEGRTTTTK